MTFKDLEMNYRRKINGSITSFCIESVGYDLDASADKIYEKWLEYCTEIIDGNRYYINRSNILMEQVIDEDLLKDIKNIFKERIEKRKNKLKEKFENEKKDATEKQIKFANDLNFEIYGEKNKFKLNEYSKRELCVIIRNLKFQLDKKHYIEGGSEIIDFNSLKKIKK